MSKIWWYFCLLCAPLLGRNPFFLLKKNKPVPVVPVIAPPQEEVSVKTVVIERPHYVLKGTIIGLKSLACIRYQDRDNFLNVGDKIGADVIVEIACGTVKLRYADGTIEELQLADKNESGEK